MTPLELFFDLVFVFAFTQVTSMLAADLSWAGLGRGMLVLAAIWWGWAAYAWLTNTLDPDEKVVRVAMFAAMAAILVTALAVPDAFDSHAFVFGLAYLAARILHLVLYALAARGHAELGRAVARMVPTLGGPLLILTASAFDGESRPRSGSSRSSSTTSPSSSPGWRAGTSRPGTSPNGSA